MQHQSTLESVLRALALTLVVVFFMFPIFWIFLMSLQTNETILRVPPSVVFEPTLANYKGIITGRLETSAASLEINFLGNLWNSIFLSVTSVTVALLLGVPAAYAFARLKFKGSERYRLYLAFLSICTATTGLAATHFVFPAIGTSRYLRGFDMGVSVDLPATHTVDCARVF